jgi:hypothetical protein
MINVVSAVERQIQVDEFPKHFQQNWDSLKEDLL